MDCACCACCDLPLLWFGGESFLSSGGLPAMDQAGTSSSSSTPLPGTFLGLALDIGGLINCMTWCRTFQTAWVFGPSGPARLL